MKDIYTEHPVEIIELANAFGLTESGKEIYKQELERITNPKQEVRTVDPITGGEKGSKLARFSLIPPEFTLALAEHYGIGAKKYADRNWEKGYKWSLSIDALERHLNSFKQGEWIDADSGSPHIIAVAWHACALFIFKIRGLGTNDIYKE